MNDDTKSAADVAGYNGKEALSKHKDFETTDNDVKQIKGIARNLDKVYEAANKPYELIPTIHELDLLLDARDARSEGRI